MDRGTKVITVSIQAGYFALLRVNNALPNVPCSFPEKVSEK